MKVILRKNFESLGQIGDTVEVKRGYALNYLIPRKIVYSAQGGNVKALEEEKYHPLLIIGNFLVEFLKIHPFSDGNGRAGRILNLLYLVDQKLLSHPVLYLSKYIITYKDDYYHHLRDQDNFARSWEIYLLLVLQLL